MHTEVMPANELPADRVTNLLEEVKRDPSQLSRNNPKGVAVYCASSIGKREVYRKAAESLGKELASKERPLIYGGGFTGLMGAVAASTLKYGGRVTGVIPRAIQQSGGEIDKVLDENASASNAAQESSDSESARYETIVVETMHERKVKMARRAGGFVGLPGGYGTFEEIFEVITWTQLGIHQKPVVLLNIYGYYEPIRALVKLAVEEGFIRRGTEQFVIFVDGPQEYCLHDDYNWGEAALTAIDSWTFDDKFIKPFDWSNVPTPRTNINLKEPKDDKAKLKESTCQCKCRESKDEEPERTEPKDEEPIDEEPTDEEPTDEEPKDEEPKDEEPKDEGVKTEVPKDANDSDESKAGEQKGDVKKSEDEESKDDPEGLKDEKPIRDKLDFT